MTIPESENNNTTRTKEDYLAHINELLDSICSGKSSKTDYQSLVNPGVPDPLLPIKLKIKQISDEISELKSSYSEIKSIAESRAEQILALNNEHNIEMAEKRLLEQAFREEENQSRIITDAAIDFIFTIDRNFILRYVNESTANALNSTAIDIKGRSVLDFISSQNCTGFRNVVYNIFNTGKPYAGESKNILPSGKEVWLDVKIIPVPDNNTADIILVIARDITDKKKSQQDLVEREEFYSKVFSGIQDGISIIDNNFRIVKVNNAIEKYYGKFKPLEGRLCYEIFQSFQESCEKYCPARTTFKTGKAAHALKSKINAEGKKIWLEISSFPFINDSTNEVIAVIENIHNVTEQKKTEEQLRQSEEKFRTLSNTVSAGLTILKDNKICYANQYLLDVSGYTFEEIKKLDFLDLVHKDYKDLLKNRHIDRKNGIEVDRDVEYKAIKKNGDELWVHLNTGTIMYEGEEATLATLWDITSQKEIEQALATEKERLDVTLSSIGDSVISTDTNTKIITVNKSAEILTGYTIEEAVGRSLDEICKVINETTHEKIPNKFTQLVAQYGIVEYKRHIMLLSRDGAEHYIDMSVSPIKMKNGNIIGMVIVFRDISERQKLESELFKARKLESLGVLAGGIAHDFNNILTGIITNLFMAKISMPIESEGYNLIVDAEKACFRASRLTKQLLTFSKGGAPVKEVASVKELIEETVGFCLSGSNANYRLDIPDDLPAATIDKGQIDQVLNNLLINAQQAMPTGGTITVTAETVTVNDYPSSEDNQALSALSAGNYIKVSIKDEGIGIKPKDMEKIFDPYYTTKPQGTGLGLTTSYSIIKNHNGIITVESKIGKGSIFSFYLPALEVSIESAASEEKKVHINGGKILIMDDDEAVRTVVDQLLGKLGYKVSCTSNGNETIELYKNAIKENDQFDVVIMDLTIPGGMGGKEVVKTLLEYNPNLKAIVFSGYSNDPVMANFRDYGFCGVIVKPFNIDEFVRVVETVITS
jgi:PAS domain S-box-containing protein